MIKSNPKSKKKPVRKTVATYDTKLIWIVVAVVLVLCASILATVGVSAFNNSFIGKVAGKRIKDYEYSYFLKSVMSEMLDDAEEAWEGEDDFDEDSYWTDDTKAEAKEKAVTEVVKWQAEYEIAVANDCKLTKEEKSNLSNNVDSYIYYYYQLYSSYSSSTYTIDQICQMVTGVTYDELDEYKAYLYKQETINKYLEKLQDSYEVSELYFEDEDGNKVTGEDAVKAQYESDIDNYRRINLTTLSISKGTAPTEPTVVTEPTAPDTEDTESTEYQEYLTNKTAYETYLTEKATYDAEFEEYNKSVEELRAKAEDVLTQINNGGYSGDGFVEVDTGEDDEDGEDIEAIKTYENASLEDIAENESTLYSSTKGANTFTGEVTSSSSFLARLAQSMNWTDDTYTAVKSSLAEEATDEEAADEEADAVDYTFESLTEDGKFKETKLKLFEDDSTFYIVKITGILDLNTSTEEEPVETEDDEDDEDSEDEEISVRATVLNDLESTKSVDDLEKMVEDGGDNYALTGRKDKVIDTVLESMFS